MAQKIDSFDFKGGNGGGKAKYPWEQWLDGGVWVLDKADFHQSLDGMGSRVRSVCKKRGLKARVHIDKENNQLTIQAYKSGEQAPAAEPEELPTAPTVPTPSRTERRRQKKAEKEAAKAEAELAAALKEEKNGQEGPTGDGLNGMREALAL
jgi:hypothetical protein